MTDSTDNSSINPFRTFATANKLFNPDIDISVSCSDYDAPLTEAGDYNQKYYRARKLISEFDPLNSMCNAFYRTLVINSFSCRNLYVCIKKFVISSASYYKINTCSKMIVVSNARNVVESYSTWKHHCNYNRI